MEAKLLQVCKDKRLCSSPAICDGEDEKDFKIFQLECQLSDVQSDPDTSADTQTDTPPDTCKEDRMKNLTCDVTCPGEDA